MKLLNTTWSIGSLFGKSSLDLTVKPLNSAFEFEVIVDVTVKQGEKRILIDPKSKNSVIMVSNFTRIHNDLDGYEIYKNKKLVIVYHNDVIIQTINMDYTK